eukprot:scaffold3210_cov223-Chaetoceros_neogracile.AAC.3
MGTPTIDDSSSRYRFYQKFPFKPIFQFFGQTNLPVFPYYHGCKFCIRKMMIDDDDDDDSIDDR